LATMGLVVVHHHPHPGASSSTSKAAASSSSSSSSAAAAAAASKVASSSSSAAVAIPAKASVAAAVPAKASAAADEDNVFKKLSDTHRDNVKKFAAASAVASFKPGPSLPAIQRNKNAGAGRGTDDDKVGKR
jgi:hypothetical protein